MTKYKGNQIGTPEGVPVRTSATTGLLNADG